jgi:hypothetical protein
MTNDEKRVTPRATSADVSPHRRFRLPVGLVAPGRDGQRRHRDGTLRAATAADEVRTLQDFRAHLRPEAFLPLMLARTIIRLGDLERLDVRQVESLCAADLEMLEEAYRELNGYPPASESSPGTETS